VLLWKGCNVIGIAADRGYSEQSSSYVGWPGAWCTQCYSKLRRLLVVRSQLCDVHALLVTHPASVSNETEIVLSRFTSSSICQPISHHPRSHHPSFLHSFTPCSKPTFSTNLFHFFYLLDCLHDKLSCRSETAQRFVSLNILLRHSRSFEMTMQCWVGRL